MQTARNHRYRGLIYWWLNCLILLALGLQQQARSQALNTQQYWQQAQSLMDTHPDSAFLLAKQLFKRGEGQDDPLALASAHLIMGQLFFDQGVFDQALSHHLKAEPYLLTAGDGQRLATHFNQMGRIYYYTSQSQLSLEHYQKALALFERLGDERGRAETLGNFGHFHEKAAQYDSALHYQQQALAIYQLLDDQTGIAQIYDHIGSIYEDQERYTLALGYFEQSRTLNELTEQHHALSINLNDIGDIHRKTGQYEKAIYYSKASLEMARKLGQQYQVKSAYRDLAKTYSLKGKYRLAYTYLDSCYALNDQLFDEKTSQQMAQMQTLFDMERKELEIAQLESEKALAAIWWAALIGGTSLLTAVAVLIVYLQRQQLRKNQKIIEQKQHILNTQQELAEAERKNAKLKEQQLTTELENQQLRENQLKAELEAKSKELTSHALHIIQKNEQLTELKTKLNEIRQSEGGKSKQLKKLVGMIDYSFNLDKDWEDFRHVFEQVHQDFFNRLQAQYPDLTASELRLCALLKLNLNSKDIATVMGIAPDSLRIARYRLRKKLQLEQGVNLVSFIMSV